MYITVGLGPLAAAPCSAASRNAAASDADALYRDREHLASAQKAGEIWAARLHASPTDYEAAWKLARVRYWLGEHEPGSPGAAQYNAAIEAARAAVAIAPDRPEGHFWLGAAMGAVAETAGIVGGLRYRGPIRTELESVLRIDRDFNRGAGLCALSHYYLKVPSLFGGSKEKAEQLARECVAADPDGTLGHYFLAEALLARNRRAQARAELQKVLDVPLEPEYIPEGKEWKERAARLLAQKH